MPISTHVSTHVSTAVTIPSRDRPESLDRLLDALAAAERPDGPLEVILVDAGAAAPIRVPADYPLPVRLLREPGGWRTRALNRALAVTGADFIIFYDDDAVPAPGALRAYTGAAERYGPGWFFGGPHVGVAADQTPVTEFGPWRDILPRSVRGLDLGGEEVALRHGPFLGFNMAAFAGDLRRVGGSPDYLGPNPERPLRGGDSILQARLLAAGMSGVYLPGARATHLVPPAHRTLPFALHRARLTGLAHALADARESYRTAAPLTAELAGAAAAAGRWAAAVARRAPRERRLRLRYEMHRDWGRVQGALLARRHRP